MIRILLALLLGFAPHAIAQPTQQPFLNVISFDASATTEVATDTLTITLFTEEQGLDPSDLAAKVNARLEQALAKAKAESAVEARSGSYQTTPVYDRTNNQITGWRIRAEMIVESRDFRKAGALAGSLQPAMKIASMGFSLSPAGREKAENALLAEALRKFQRKARAIATTMGFPDYTLSQVAVRTEGDIVRPPMPYRAIAAPALADAAPPVPTEGGKNTVTVTVSGTVVLGPAK
jgi:predicted secreted protein